MELRVVIDNDTATRSKIHLKVLWATKCESGGVAMMRKTGIKVAQDYTIFNHVLQIPYNNVNYQDITIVTGIGVNLALKCVLSGNSE